MLQRETTIQQPINVDDDDANSVHDMAADDAITIDSDNDNDKPATNTVDDDAADEQPQPTVQPPKQSIAINRMRRTVRKPQRLIKHGYIGRKLLYHRKQKGKQWYDAHRLDCRELQEEALQAIHWDLF
jgi:hypothetical protein